MMPGKVMRWAKMPYRFGWRGMLRNPIPSVTSHRSRRKVQYGITNDRTFSHSAVSDAVVAHGVNVEQ